MKTSAAGQEGYAAVRSALLKMDVQDKPIPPSATTTTKSFPAEVQEPVQDRNANKEVREVYLTDIDDSVELPEDDVDTFLAALDEQDLGEHEVLQVFAAIVEDRLGRPRRR
eukprot:6454501-Pyramimonas_sp.AAC.1